MLDSVIEASPGRTGLNTGSEWTKLVLRWRERGTRTGKGAKAELQRQKGAAREAM